MSLLRSQRFSRTCSQKSEAEVGVRCSSQADTPLGVLASWQDDLLPLNEGGVQVEFGVQRLNLLYGNAPLGRNIGQLLSISYRIRPVPSVAHPESNTLRVQSYA
eukprot:scaffold2799_cov408-Prasinococcus_capsulatus_cf.AAC.39